ncbi:hypothetical protein [Cellulomonas chitinilytica]|uniref:hypothetical protein n=1 Tax=Cellulomonas chitinilytica TaxID=398759 RepID=UPI0019448147|nr:hypothetical protein [Cellulomonas chitinilytica]
MVHIDTSSAQRLQDALHEARKISEETLAEEPLDALLQALLDQHGPRLVEVAFDRRYSPPRQGHIALRYPATGDVGRLGHGYLSSGDQHELSFTLTPKPGAVLTAADLQSGIDAIESRLREQQDEANEAIAREQIEFAEAVREKLEPRWQMTRMLRGALAELAIPLAPTPGPALVPVHARHLSLTAVTAAAGDGTPEWALEERLADGVVATIGAFGRSLERSPAAASRLVGGDEETLRDVLLCVLNGSYEGLVTGETFIGDGKSDLLLRWRDRDAFVGECKMWSGSKALEAGVEQLLSRYTLWRQARVALVVFFDQPSDATTLIERACTAIREHPRTRRVIDESEPARRSDYEVSGSGDERRPARLTFLPVVLRHPLPGAAA